MTHYSNYQHRAPFPSRNRTGDRHARLLDKKQFGAFKKLLDKIKNETKLKGEGLMKYIGFNRQQMCDFNVRNELTLNNAKKILTAFNKMEGK